MKATYNIEDLIRGCLKKQPRHQRALVDKYSGFLLAICNRYLRDGNYAKDVLQDSMIRIFQNLDKYKSEKGSFESWITTIAINQCLSKLKKNKIALLDLDTCSSSESTLTVDSGLLDNHDTELLLNLIAELPDTYRAVFNMAAIDGYSHKEIAAILGINISASRSRLNRAKNILKERVNTLQKNESWVNTI